MFYADFNYEYFPTVIIKFTGEKATDANFKDYLAEIKSIYDRKEAFVLIFDATNASMPGFKYQKMQADWLRKHDQLIRTYCLGTAYIIPNVIIRGILNSIFTLQKQPVPFAVVNEMNKAVAFANSLSMDSYQVNI